MWSNLSVDQRNFTFLLILCCQNATLILLTRYSHAILREPYSPAVVVFCMEMTKFVISGLYILSDRNWEIRKCNYGELLRTSLRMSVPGFTYVVQNTLQFISLQHLDASTFTIFAQLKTLTAAAFAVAMLRQRISPRKWRALILLVVGAILVQYNPVREAAVSDSQHAERNFSFGLICVISMVALSGFSGIYLEKYLKDQSNSIYERNFQLGFWGMIFSTFSIISQDLDRVQKYGIFNGFSLITLLIVGVGAGGGIVVALVVKYTSTIIKGFATSMSIILTSVLSYFIFQSQLGLLFVLGAVCVFISIFNYNEEEPKSSYKPEKPDQTPNLHPIVMEHRNSGATREREGMASSRVAIEV